MKYGEGIGEIGWIDLTVAPASSVADFYSEVVGWRKEPVSMGAYDDFNMVSPHGAAVGVCHARGDNAHMPPLWLMYVNVESVRNSIARCEALGGKLRIGPKTMAGQQFAVIEDPSGAVVGIMSKET